MFNSLTLRISKLLTSLTNQNKLSNQNLEQVLGDIKDSLLQADVPYEVVEQLVGEVKSEVVGQKILAKLNPVSSLLRFFMSVYKVF